MSVMMNKFKMFRRMFKMFKHVPLLCHETTINCYRDICIQS